MKKYILLISSLFLMMVVTAQPPGISVKPVRLFYNLLNGQAAVQTVYVINGTTQPQQFRLYLQDWTRDTFGVHTYMKLDSFPHSCSRWVKFNKEFVELQPGETGEVLVRVEVPDSLDAIKEMKWTMLFIESVEEKLAPSQKKGITTTIHNISRIGVHVVQTPPTLKDKDVKMISFTRQPGKNHFRIICQNMGNIQFDCNSYLELSSVATGEKTTVRANLFPLFPNQVRYIDFVLPDTLPKGKYTMVGVIDAGDDVPLQASETTIEIL